MFTIIKHIKGKALSLTSPVGVGLIFRFVVSITKKLCNQINLKLYQRTSLLLRQKNGSFYVWNKFDFWCPLARLLSSSDIKITILYNILLG